jgi:hypothetical protein
MKPCRDVEALMDRRAGGLADAERLVLEQHLAECASCREVDDMMRQVVSTIEQAPASLSEIARERAMVKAFASVQAGSSLRETRAGTRRTGAWLAAAAALLVCVRFASHEPAPAERLASSGRAGDHGRSEARDTAAASGSSSDRSAEAAGSARERRLEQPAPTRDVAVSEARDEGWLEAIERETRTFAHARVELAPGSRMRFRHANSTLELERGRVQVELEPGGKEPFSVVTRNFRVQVLGTAFAVSPERVEVQRGRVQVFDRRGGVLARELSQGATFTYRAPEGKRDRKLLAPTEQPLNGAQTLSAAQLLAQARAELARGDVPAARASVERAEQSQPTRMNRAEAETLKAECALLDRDMALAIGTYLHVAEQFSDLAAGENAAFAAAQLTARAHDKAAARTLFERYLERYPHGRFATEARGRLGADAR